MRSQVRVVDLFCGVGGLSLGLDLAGFDVVASYDNWREAADVYERNLKRRPFTLDLSNVPEAVEHISEFKPDIIAGGPPCQDFSSAGRRTEGNNAQLTLSFAEIICAIKPKMFLLENVARTRFSRTYLAARQKLEEAGFGVEEVVLNASTCGVPQSRRRFFSIGVWENPLMKQLRDSIYDNMSKTPLTVGQYMGDELDINDYYRHPRNYSRRGVYSIHEPSATIRGVNRPIPPNYPGHHLDTADFREVRPLTTAERSRIQTFPRSWQWIGGKTKVEQMIGNAVPVNLSKYVGQRIAEAVP